MGMNPVATRIALVLLDAGVPAMPLVLPGPPQSLQGEVEVRRDRRFGEAVVKMLDVSHVVSPPAIFTTPHPP